MIEVTLGQKGKNRMRLLEKLGVCSCHADIDWDITPALTYGMFECRGDMDLVRSKDQRFYYFFIDNWVQPARLCLMERGIRHARVLAQILAPQDLIDCCVQEQGTTHKEQSFAIDGALRGWLQNHLLDTLDESKVIPLASLPEKVDEKAMDLPGANAPFPTVTAVRLRNLPTIIREGEIEAIVRRHNFYECSYNPQGVFANLLVDNKDGLTVTDRVTNLMWQRAGIDWCFFRRLRKRIEETNRSAFAGYHDWRLPTVEEALSLLNPSAGEQGLHIHSCFEVPQGFIYTADRRDPGGYWFVDFRHARVFWAGGTFSGGFGRLCRSAGEDQTRDGGDRR